MPDAKAGGVPTPDEVGKAKAILERYLQHFPEQGRGAPPHGLQRSRTEDNPRNLRQRLADHVLENVAKYLVAGVLAVIAAAALWVKARVDDGTLISILGGVPASGAVVAFNGTQAHNHQCPDGWEIMPNAQGRFIVGAGSQFVALADTGTGTPDGKLLPATGGEASVKLGLEHLPDHAHGITGRTGPVMGGRAGGGTPHLPNAGDIPVFGPAENSGGLLRSGPQKRLDILPPYVALYFCRQVPTK